MALRHESLAPKAYRISHLRVVICQETEAARALGFYFACDETAADRGWDRDTYNDHDGFHALVSAAIAKAKDTARDDKLFYNKELLEETVLDILVEAYQLGFDDGGTAR